MNIKKIGSFFAFLVCVWCLTSCQTREEKIITRIDKLSERIEKHGQDFDAEDWAEAMEDLADIHEDMEDCNFTKEEMEKLGRADGKLAAIIATEGTKAIERSVSSTLDFLSPYVKGFMQGAHENFKEEEFQKANDGIVSAAEDFGKDVEYLVDSI